MAQLWEKDAPIIRSLLETDVYKILMLFYIWVYYPYLKVKWAFKNRTVKVPLGQYVNIDELREQLQAVINLRFSDAEISYIRGWGMFPEKFLKKLQGLRLTMPHISSDDGGLMLNIEASGTWFETTLWEIYILAIIAELYGRGFAKAEGLWEQNLYNDGLARHKRKVDFLKKHPELKIALFGLRRRFSGPWEEFITEDFLTRTKNITGVSNVYLAMKYGVEAQGTNAHELPMAEYAVARHSSPAYVRQTPYRVLERWQKLYGHKALIMLSDTFGTDAFLRDLPTEYALQWRGHRQDSGDAVEIGEKIIADYERRVIDPREKIILFTDGLNCERMLELYTTFVERILVGFGVGTNFSNDFGAIRALSIVMKLVEAAGNMTVKLSDNLAKALGAREEVEIAKEIYGYTNQFREETTY
jgi:nicotinate phosphoribosyltransferase